MKTIRTNKFNTALICIAAMASMVWAINIAVIINELIDKVAMLIVEIGGTYG